MTNSQLPTSTPSAEGVDAAGILRVLDRLEAASGVEMHSLMMLRHGKVIAQGWWAPYTADRLHLLYSLSKSFTSTALGLAIAEGRLSLDDRIVDLLPDFVDDRTDDRVKRIKVRHVAAMASGHTADMWIPAENLDSQDPLRGFLRMPPEREPGSVFAYNQPATYAVATILQNITGQTLSDYLRPRLFDPLGIGAVGWLQKPVGRDLGWTGLHATTDAIARLGQLYLQRGRWNGRQILPEEWVAQATSVQINNADNPMAGGPDWLQGYGFQFWMGQHGYRGDGACGQYCIMLPEQDIVIAITGQTEFMEKVLETLWSELLPAVDSGVGTGDASADADSALAERLVRLELSGPQGHSGLDTVEFTPDGGACGAQPSLTKVVVTGDQLTLVETGWQLTVPIGHGAWAVTDDQPADRSVAVATRGGWQSDHGFACAIAFLETPHRLIVRANRRSSTFAAVWDCAPLHAPSLGGLRAPRPTDTPTAGW